MTHSTRPQSSLNAPTPVLRTTSHDTFSEHAAIQALLVIADSFCVRKAARREGRPDVISCNILQYELPWRHIRPPIRLQRPTASPPLDALHASCPSTPILALAALFYQQNSSLGSLETGTMFSIEDAPLATVTLVPPRARMSILRLSTCVLQFLNLLIAPIHRGPAENRID